MIGWEGAYCYEHDENGRLYKRPRNSEKRFDVFPMGVAVIAIDSHSNYVIYTLMYEPLIRGKGTEQDAINAAKEMQPGVSIEWERIRYIARCGVTTLKAGVYKI